MKTEAVEVSHGRGYVYSMQYHVVWCVKYRRKVLKGVVAERLLELLDDIARDNGFEIVESNTAEDHVQSVAELQTTELHSQYYESPQGCFGKAAHEGIRS